MPFTLYDSRQRKLVPFEPLTPGKVSIYNCGPTVYSDAHIGNFRAFVLADLLRRTLEWEGLEVTQVMNITDVGHLTEDDRADAGGEDKLQKKAKELGWDPFRLARHYEDKFHEDRRALGIQDAAVYPRATEHICDMLVQIQQLLDRGHAYMAADSSGVYYDVASFPEYGKLSGKTLDELQAGARVEINLSKRHPADFALWKVDSGHLMQWDPQSDELWKNFPGKRPALDPRLSRGFPGWHIECSAMSIRYLGHEFDLHTGGEDNAFPHHECEIAQAQGATGGHFARYWMHNRFLMVDGGKMSKSAGTLYTLADVIERGYSATELRYVLLSNHYRQPMNFTFEGMTAARASIQRLQNVRNLLCEKSQPGEPGAAAVALSSQFKAQYREALDDDLNISNALAALFAFASEINKWEFSPGDAEHFLSVFDRADHVIGVLSDDSLKTGCVSPQYLEAHSVSEEEIAKLLATSISAQTVTQLACARHHARKNKNWAGADAIRDHLKAAGVVFEDLPEGVRYKLP